jgi:hypothetical protein
MKKVRYAAGALGALGAVPTTLGLVTPAAAAATQAPSGNSKTVSLAAVATTAPCNARGAGSGSGMVNFTASISYSRDNGCIGGVHATLNQHTGKGYWMRVRSYTNGHLAYSRFNKNGVISKPTSTINWHSTPRHTGIGQVCEAVVRSTAPGTVLYGPRCENTGYPG